MPINNDGKKANGSLSKQISDIKAKRNSGKKYTSIRSGNIISERCSKELGVCRLRCKEKISDEYRLIVFNEYWKLGKYTSRVAYMFRRIQDSLKQSSKNLYANKKERNYTYKYRIFVGDTAENVCKKCFLNIHGETEGFLRSVQQKIVGKKNLEDQRGKSPTSKNSLPPSKKDEIIAHIRSFPAYESHYSRAHTNQKYLAENLNLFKMYELYKDNMENYVSYATYRRLFKKEKLKFKKPSLDTCSKCDQFSIAIKHAKSYEIKNQLIVDRDKHQKLAEEAYANKKSDKTDVTKTVLCMDLQKCLPTPNLNSSIAFYKRCLWTFNFTIRNCSTKKTYCFVWNETIGGRGANEIASCIWKYFKMNIDLKSHVVIYSDTCSGQNKNNIVTAMLVLLVNQRGINVELIEQKFLEPGHTHLECDSDHSIIERQKKKNVLEVYHPHDWIQLIKTCGRKSNKFEVFEMNTADFLNFEKTFKHIFQKVNKNINGEKVLWKKCEILFIKKVRLIKLNLKNILVVLLSKLRYLKVKKFHQKMFPTIDFSLRMLKNFLFLPRKKKT